MAQTMTFGASQLTKPIRTRRSGPAKCPIPHQVIKNDKALEERNT